jgi:hypothetical protein
MDEKNLPLAVVLKADFVYHLNKWGKRTGSIESFAESE